MLSKNPNHVQDLSRDMLNWNSDKISEQISDVNTTISILKDENFKDLFIKKATNEKVDRDIYSISSEIQKFFKRQEMTVKVGLPLIRTKFHQPPVPADHVRRPERRPRSGKADGRRLKEDGDESRSGSADFLRSDRPSDTGGGDDPGVADQAGRDRDRNRYVGQRRRDGG